MKVLSLMLSLGLAGSALAQEKPESPPAVQVERTKSGKKLTRILDGSRVKAEAAAPRVFYVLKRAETDYVAESAAPTFLPQILRAASQSPF